MKNPLFTRRMLIRVFLLLIVVSFSEKAIAYTPPIGIPDPGMWGAVHPIDTTAPSTSIKCPGWPASVSSGCYYIDNTHPQATDTSNSNGYPNKPRVTIPTSYAAGSFVWMQGGPYSASQTLTFNGTADNPIWFRGNPDSMPTFTGRLTVGTGSSYAIMEYLDFNGGSSACISLIGLSIRNIGIRNSKFRNRLWTNNTAAIGSTPAQGGSIHDIVVYNNLLYSLGDWQSAADQDFHGINPTLWGRTPPTTQYNFWALNNTGYYISGNLVQTNGGEASDLIRPYLHHIYVGKNYAHHGRQSGFATKQATDVIISQPRSL